MSGGSAGIGDSPCCADSADVRMATTTSVEADFEIFIGGNTLYVETLNSPSLPPFAAFAMPCVFRRSNAQNHLLFGEKQFVLGSYTSKFWNILPVRGCAASGQEIYRGALRLSATAARIAENGCCSKTVVVPCSRRCKSVQNESERLACKRLRSKVEYRIFITDQNLPGYSKSAGPQIRGGSTPPSRHHS